LPWTNTLAYYTKKLRKKKVFDIGLCLLVRSILSRLIAKMGATTLIRTTLSITTELNGPVCDTQHKLLHSAIECNYAVSPQVAPMAPDRQGWLAPVEPTAKLGEGET
jgi:hypothetical protein